MKNLLKRLEPVWLFALLIFPIVLWILPPDFFDEGPAVCPSRVFFDIECFGCGMTRAVMHLHHFDYEEAFYYNYGVLLIYPALVIVWGFWVYTSANRMFPGLMKRNSDPMIQEKKQA